MKTYSIFGTRNKVLLLVSVVAVCVLAWMFMGKTDHVKADRVTSIYVEYYSSGMGFFVTRKSVSLNSDGEVLWDGKAAKRIAPQKFRRLAQLFVGRDFEGLAEDIDAISYGGGHQGIITVTLTSGEEQRTVSFQRGRIDCRGYIPEMCRLKLEMRLLIGAVKWTSGYKGNLGL